MSVPTPAPAAKPCRRARRWLAALAVVGLLLAGLVWFAPAIVATTGLRNAVVARIFAPLNGTITVGSASLGWFSPVELRDVSVTDPAGRTALTAARVTSSKTLRALATDQTHLGTFTIEAPVLEVVCEPGTTNVEQAIANYLADDSPSGPERTGLAVTVTGGRVVLKDAGRDGQQVLEAVAGTVTVPKPAAEPITLDVSATSHPGTASVGMVFRSPTELTVAADRFAVEPLGPLVRRFAADTTFAGQLTAKLAAKLGSDDAGRTHAAVNGRADVAGLDLAAPWLGEDRVRLRHAELPCVAELVGDELRVAHAALSCDAGGVVVAGTVNLSEPADRLLARPGLKADADVDLAKLAAIVPRLLRLRPGTELREGRITLHLASTAGVTGTEWGGTVETTALRGARDGKPLVWEKPLWAEFAGRLRSDGRPVFDKLQCRSDFIGLNARGSPEEFVAAANLNLDRLSARLAEFVDLGGVTLAGSAEVQAQVGPATGGGHALAFSAKLTRFAFADGSGRALREPDLRVTAEAAGAAAPAGPVRLDSGTAVVQADGDELRVALLEPVADARTARGGRLAVRVAGDVTRWHRRLAAFVSLPNDWTAAGTGTVAGTVALTEAGATADRVTADLRNLRFNGAGLSVAEPTLTAEAGVTWVRTAGTLTLTNLTASSETATVSAGRLDVRPDGVTGRATTTANVARLQRTLALLPNDPLAGTAAGTVAVDATGGRVGFDADLDGRNLVIGPAARPAWTEPWAKLTAAGEYSPKADAVTVRALKASRDGLAADATGTVGQLRTVPHLDLGGTVAYDLSKLEPTLRRYLGHQAAVAGKGARPFKLTGPLAGGGADPLAHLSGSAAVAWQQVRAFGFEVGPAELKATLDRGQVTTSPVEAAFGGGKVRLEPKVNLTSAAFDLTFAPGRVVERARLTPAACADALGFALPAIANAAQADGLVSFDLGPNVIPLANPTAAAVAGRLTVHTATLTPGPLVTEIATLLGAKQTTLTLTTEQVVGVQLKDGKVWHDRFALTFGKTTVTTAGAVGLDGALNLVVELPVPSRVLDKVPANRPLIREALAKQTIKVPVGGTVNRPHLDPRLLEAQGQQMVQAALKETGAKLADDLIQKGQDKLFDRLRDKLAPKPPPAPPKP